MNNQCIRIAGIFLILVVISGCAGIPKTKTVILNNELAFSEPRIQLIDHNLDNLKSIRDGLGDGSFLAGSLFRDNNVECVVNEERDNSLPHLYISVFEETRHIEFKTEYHGYIAFLIRYEGESIYYRNYSFIRKHSMHSQRILMPILETQIKKTAKDFLKHFVTSE